MPYIHPANRRPINNALKRLPWTSMNKGDLTYLFYLAMLSWVETGREKSYSTLSSAMSSARDAEQEFMRRELWPYEDEKRRRVGRVEVER